MKLATTMAMVGLALATSATPGAGVTSAPRVVQCCLKLAIDGEAEPARCLKVNFNITPRRLAKHPKRACRVVGGTPATAAVCTCG